MLNAMASFSFLSAEWPQKSCWYTVDVLQGEGSMCPGSSEANSFLAPLYGHICEECAKSQHAPPIHSKELVS